MRSARDNPGRDYDVCLSFAGEQRDYVDQVAESLLAAHVRIFYDRYKTTELWGEDLVDHLDQVFRNRADFCVMFVSEAYARKVWTRHERVSAQARALRNAGAYVLPVRFDDTEIPGLLETVGFVDANVLTPEEVAALIVEKIRGRDESSGARPPRHAPRVNAALSELRADPPRAIERRVVSRQLSGLSAILGRDDILEELSTRFFDGSRQSERSPCMQVIAGIGGIGKTSIARAYGLRNQDRYGLIWWIRTEDSALVLDDFRNLLHALRQPDVERVDDPVQLAHVLLGNHEDRWLLIFDNVAQHPSLRGILPPDGLGDVLITTRSSTWPDPSVVTHVPPLSSAMGARLLLGITMDGNETAAIALTEELGGLPLALHQAASYVATNPVDLHDYLRLYRQHRPDLHNEGSAPDYDLRVGTTWEVTFRMLSDSARTVLNVLSWCEADMIPLDLLAGSAHFAGVPETVADKIDGVFGNELRYNTAIGDLVRYGVIRVTGRDASIHRVVQAVTLDKNSAAEREDWAAATAALLFAAVPRPPANARSMTQWARLRPHFQHLVRTTPLRDHPMTLRLRHWLAQWTGEVGRPSDAVAMFTDLIEKQKRVLGTEHVDTFQSRHSLAQWTGELGQFDDAVRLFDALIADMSGVIGPDHPETLRAVHSSAYWIGESGDAKSACARLDDLLRRRERVLGANHPDTLRTKHSLAFRTGQAGRPQLACEMLQELLPVRAEVLGPDHPHTLRTRYSLAQWTGHGGDAETAMQMTELLLADQSRVLGSDHPHTLRTRYNLAHWTGQAGNMTARHELLTALITDQDRILGTDHPDTVRTRNLLEDPSAQY